MLVVLLRLEAQKPAPTFTSSHSSGASLRYPGNIKENRSSPVSAATGLLSLSLWVSTPHFSSSHAHFTSLHSKVQVQPSENYYSIHRFFIRERYLFSCRVKACSAGISSVSYPVSSFSLLFPHFTLLFFFLKKK